MQPTSLLIAIILLLAWFVCWPTTQRATIIEDAPPTPIQPDRH
jgi:hypothetical protein